MATINVSLPSDGTTADAADYNTPINTIVSEFNGNIDNANIKSGAAIAGSKIADASVDVGTKASQWDGWIAVSDSWSYASATTITVPTDATTKYSIGDRVKFVQSSTTKYFTITALTTTVLTLQGQAGTTVANSAITGVYYSKAYTPLGIAPFITNPYCFRAYHNTTQNSGNGVYASVSFNTENFDPMGHFASNTYTASAPGIYFFHAGTRTSSACQRLTIGIAVNGTPAIRGSELYDDDNHTGAATQASGILQLASGDTVTCQSLGNTTLTLDSGSALTYFGGFLVYAQ